jgi:hypothetical protein
VRKLLLAVCLFWFVDRIEGDWAILISAQNEHVEVLVSRLPPGTKEGDCVKALPHP